MNNSIVAENTLIGEPRSSGTDILGSATANFSLIGDIEGATIVGTNNVTDVDPMLGPLADNGGPTLTHALLSGSPAIDAGNNARALDDNSIPLTTDQRGLGVDRIKFGTVDMGAVESDFDVSASAPVVSETIRDEGGVLARPDLLSTYAVTFDQNVNVSEDDLSVFNETLGGSSVDLSSVTAIYDPLTYTATWSFNTLVLEAAFYTFELSSDIEGTDGGFSLDGGGLGTGGTNRVEDVYVAIPGDANLDGQVNVLGDAFTLVGNLGTTGGATWAQGDFNNDGNVNVLGDAFALVGNLGTNVIPPATWKLNLSAISDESSNTLTADPVLMKTDWIQNDAEDKGDPHRKLEPIASATPNLSGSQTLDDAFASEDWLI
jgi:hypothetical protein